MQPVTHFSVKAAILLGATLLLQQSFAGELPDLPAAFDAGWQGQVTCELLNETESVRVARRYGED